METKGNNSSPWRPAAGLANSAYSQVISEREITCESQKERIPTTSFFKGVRRKTGELKASNNWVKTWQMKNSVLKFKIIYMGKTISHKQMWALNWLQPLRWFQEKGTVSSLLGNHPESKGTANGQERKEEGNKKYVLIHARMRYMCFLNSQASLDPPSR